VNLEARLPGLAQWARVRDWRVTQLQKMANVAIYRENDIGANDVLEFGAERVVLATGCHWRRDGYGRSNGAAIPGFDSVHVFTPDDLMRGRMPDGPVLLFDDDAFYIGSVMAEVLRAAGREVVYVTPDDVVASWTTYTQEYRHVQQRLRSLGMQIVTGHGTWRKNGASPGSARLGSSSHRPWRKARPRPVTSDAGTAVCFP